MHRSLAALVPLLLVAGCNSTDGSAGNARAVETGRWILTSYRTAGGLRVVPAGVTADATFKDGTVSGSGGCNGYSGTCTVSGSTLNIRDVNATMMACDGPRSEVEQAYLAALPTAAAFTVTAGKLTILDGTGAVILEYTGGPARG